MQVCLTLLLFFPHKLPLLLLKEEKEGAEYGRDGGREGGMERGREGWKGDRERRGEGEYVPEDDNLNREKCEIQ